MTLYNNKQLHRLDYRFKMSLGFFVLSDLRSVGSSNCTLLDKLCVGVLGESFLMALGVLELIGLFSI